MFFFERYYMENIFSELYSYDEGLSCHNDSVADYVHFLKEYNGVVESSLRKPSLSDYDAVAVYLD